MPLPRSNGSTDVQARPRKHLTIHLLLFRRYSSTPPSQPSEYDNPLLRLFGRSQLLPNIMRVLQPKRKGSCSSAAVSDRSLSFLRPASHGFKAWAATTDTHCSRRPPTSRARVLCHQPPSATSHPLPPPPPGLAPAAFSSSYRRFEVVTSCARPGRPAGSRTYAAGTSPRAWDWRGLVRPANPGPVRQASTWRSWRVGRAVARPASTGSKVEKARPLRRVLGRRAWWRATRRCLETKAT